MFGLLMAVCMLAGKMHFTHFTLVPPGPVTDKIRVELRLAARNSSTAEQAFTFHFYWDRADAAHQIGQQTVTAPPNGFAFARVWWPTDGHTGKHTLLYRVASAAGTEEGRQTIEVISSRTRALPLLQACWFDPGGLFGAYPRDKNIGEQDVRAMVDAMHRLGMQTIIVTYVEYTGHIYYPSNSPSTTMTSSRTPASCLSASICWRPCCRRLISGTCTSFWGWGVAGIPGCSGSSKKRIGRNGMPQRSRRGNGSLPSYGSATISIPRSMAGI